MSDISEKVEALGLALAIVVVTISVGAIFFGIMTVFSEANTSQRADERCQNRGYKYGEAVVHYPKFWNVDTLCFDGANIKKGIKL